MTSRSYCFTTFKVSQEWKTNNKIKYVVWQEEKCPDSGRLHLQGYVELVSPTRVAGVKKLMGDSTMHLEKRRGTRQQARDYCVKEDSRTRGPWEFGEFSAGGQGKRSDIAAAVDVIRGGGGVGELLEQHPTVFVKYTRGLRAVQSFYNGRDKRERELNVRVYWGSSGVGKTKRAVAEAKDDDYFILGRDADKVWWDGYEGQPYLIIDEFYGWIPWGYFLRILDRYPLRLAIKGGFVWARWTTVVITSNKAPREWYERGLPTELRRRLHVIERLGEPIDPFAPIVE